MTDDENIIPGPLKGASSPEEVEVASYKPPNKHRIQFKQRVFEIENWIAKRGFVERELVIIHIESRYSLEREQALEYFAEVVKDFRRLERVYGGTD